MADMDATPFLAALAAAREELLADLSPEGRVLWDAASAAYCAEVDRIRENSARLAERAAERSAAWGEAWEGAMRVAWVPHIDPGPLGREIEQALGS
jgi:hypothetical protein